MYQHQQWIQVMTYIWTPSNHFVGGDFSEGADPLIDHVSVDGFENLLDDQDNHHHKGDLDLNDADHSLLANDDQSHMDNAIQDLHVHIKSNEQ